MQFEEYVSSESLPSIRAEHEIRYRAAFATLACGASWCDLGCGTGVASAAALPDNFAGDVLLVDRASSLLEEAAGNLPRLRVTRLLADLATRDGTALISEELAAPRWRQCTVTCFEVLEHLENVDPIISLFRELAFRGTCTVVLSVPNDAFTGVRNPYHLGKWGSSATEELAQLLPTPLVQARQLPLQGSYIVRADRPEREVPLSVRLDPAAEPSHFLLAFGPHSHRLAENGVLLQNDIAAQRAWERQREADLAYLRQLAGEI